MDGAGCVRRRARPRDRAVEGPVHLDRRRVELEAAHARRHPRAAGRRGRPAGRTGRGDHVGDHRAAGGDPLAVRGAHRRSRDRRSTSMPVDLGVARGSRRRADSSRRASASGELAGAALGHREADGLAEHASSAAPSARSPARRAGCRRAPALPGEQQPRRRRRRTGCARARRPGVSRVLTKREPADAGAAGPARPSPARTGGNGVSSAPTRCGADPVPLGAQLAARRRRHRGAARPAARRSPRGRGAAAPTRRPASGARAPPGACRQLSPCSSRPKARIVRRGGRERVEGAERVVHEVRVDVARRCAPRRRPRAAPPARAPTSRRRRAGSPRPARWARPRPRPRRTTASGTRSTRASALARRSTM